MKCDNYFCIFYEEEECLFEETELDILGSCKNCIYVRIPDEELKKLRKEQLERYINSD